MKRGISSLRGLWGTAVILLWGRPVLAMTNEQRGFAFGFGTVILAAWIVGIIFFVRWLKRTRPRRKRYRMDARGANSKEFSKRL